MRAAPWPRAAGRGADSTVISPARQSRSSGRSAATFPGTQPKPQHQHDHRMVTAPSRPPPITGAQQRSRLRLTNPLRQQRTPPPGHRQHRCRQVRLDQPGQLAVAQERTQPDRIPPHRRRRPAGHLGQHRLGNRSRGQVTYAPLAMLRKEAAQGPARTSPPSQPTRRAPRAGSRRTRPTAIRPASSQWCSIWTSAPPSPRMDGGSISQSTRIMPSRSRGSPYTAGDPAPGRHNHDLGIIGDRARHLGGGAACPSPWLDASLIRLGADCALTPGSINPPGKTAVLRWPPAEPATSIAVDGLRGLTSR